MKQTGIRAWLRLAALSITITMAAGCNSGKALENAGHKSLIGDGYITINKVMVTDTTTNSYTPQVFSMILSGRYVSLLKDTRFLYYDKKTNASILNSHAVSTDETLVIQVGNNETVAGVLEQIMKKAAASGGETAAVAASDEGK